MRESNGFFLITCHSDTRSDDGAHKETSEALAEDCAVAGDGLGLRRPGSQVLQQREQPQLFFLLVAQFQFQPQFEFERQPQFELQFQPQLQSQFEFELRPQLQLVRPFLQQRFKLNVRLLEEQLVQSHLELIGRHLIEPPVQFHREQFVEPQRQPFFEQQRCEPKFEPEFDQPQQLGCECGQLGSGQLQQELQLGQRSELWFGDFRSEFGTRGHCGQLCEQHQVVQLRRWQELQFKFDVGRRQPARLLLRQELFVWVQFRHQQNAFGERKGGRLRIGDAGKGRHARAESRQLFSV